MTEPLSTRAAKRCHASTEVRSPQEGRRASSKGELLPVSGRQILPLPNHAGQDVSPSRSWVGPERVAKRKRGAGN